MDLAAYAAEAEVEASHWWFVGRRKLFASELARMGVTPQSRTLDIGTSTGTNLRMLRDLGYADVTGLDLSDDAIRFCAEKGLGPVRRGNICEMPFEDASFDLVLATDVIEHVDDDGKALAEIARVLAPGGKVLITVPAFTSLWGLQDEVAHHKRRYRLIHLRQKIQRAGLRPLSIYYFNFILFLPIWLARRVIALMGARLHSEAEINGPLLNAILTQIFRLDIEVAPLPCPPFGVSILVAGAK